MKNRRFSFSISLVFCGLPAAAAIAQDATGHVLFEASNDGGTTWASSVVTTPGSRVDVRVRVQLLNPPLAIRGFGGMTYQPTLSNWFSPAGDARLPFTSSDGSGVPDVPGNTGRIFPFNSVNQSTTGASGLLTSFNDPNNVLRFAGANCIAPTTNLSWGVNSAQLSPALGGTNFNPSLDVVIFKYAVVLGASSGARILTADLPIANIQSARMTWHQVQDGLLYTLRQSDILPATINVVPAPNGFTMLACAGLCSSRRRRDQP